MKKRNILPFILIIFLSSVLHTKAIEKSDFPSDNKDSTFLDIGVDNIFVGRQKQCYFRLRKITAVVRNHGTEPVSNFDILIYRNDILITTLTKTTILYPGNFSDIVFFPYIFFSNTDSTCLKVCVILPNDENPNNDYYEKSYPMVIDSSLCNPQYSHGCNFGGSISHIEMSYLSIDTTCFYNLNWYESYDYATYCGTVHAYGYSVIKLIAETDSVYFSGWIDFNEDHDLTDNEKVIDCEFLEFAGQEYSFEFVIPECVQGQNMKIRIRTCTNECPDHPCALYYSGVTLDFWVYKMGGACGYDASVDSILVPNPVIEASEIIPTAIVGNHNCSNHNAFGTDIRILKENNLIYYSDYEVSLCHNSTEIVQFNPWLADTGIYVVNVCVHSDWVNYPEDNCKEIEVTVVDKKVLVLKVFLEGCFNGILMNNTLFIEDDIPLNQPYFSAPWNYSGTESVDSIPNSNVIDWVLVELRDTTNVEFATENTIISCQAAFLLRDGTITGIDGKTPLLFDVDISNNLFVVIKHRNHLGIISSIPITRNNGIFYYDFTLSKDQVFGGENACKELAPGIWGMIGGDGDANNQIGNADKNDVWAVQAGTSGYLSGDFTMDVQVNNTDKNDIWAPNCGKGGQVPDEQNKIIYKSYVPR
ncbi:MAG: hypothetical protein K8R58_10370 [Bacteroidales bacterium]|nr:hypothetical protein [Bacteroidales bacterium]